MRIGELRELRFGDRVMHIDSHTLATVEAVSTWSTGRVEVTVRFAGDPRTDPWGPFEESPRYSDEDARDLERIVIDWGNFYDWAHA